MAMNIYILMSDRDSQFTKGDIRELAGGREGPFTNGWRLATEFEIELYMLGHLKILDITF